MDQTFLFDTSCYTILWITQGKGSVKIDFKEYELLPRRLVYIVPGQKASVLKQPVAGHVLLFSEEFLLRANDDNGQGIALNWLLTPKIFFDLDEIQLLDFISLWEIVERNWKNADLDFLIAKLINVMWIYPQILNIKRNDSASLDEDWELINQLKKMVEHCFKEHKDSGFYARKLNVPIWKLNKICKQVLGSSVHDLVLDRTILEAKRLLASTNRSIKEINFELGFKDPSYFNKVFKRVCGLSPSTYRTDK